MGDRGFAEAALAGLAGTALAACGPAAIASVEGTWQRIVVMSLVLATMLVLVAAFVLALVAAMHTRLATCDPDDAPSRRLLTTADALLIATAGLAAITAVFLFVLAVIRLA